ncbi:MAG: hypothetical protein HQL01_10880 [Nitrospirae bacterium]|nr:hypothetical protein [Nitrospirota bacterium]
MEARDITELYGTSKIELLDDTKAKWIECFINGSDTFDKTQVSEAIHWIYDTHKLGRPKITFTGSPGEYLSKIMYLTNTKADKLVTATMKDYFDRNVRLRRSLWYHTSDDTSFESATNPYKNLILRTFSSDRQQIQQISGLLKGNGLWDDGCWFYVYAYAMAAGLCDDERIGLYKDYLQGGALLGKFFHKNAIVCEGPEYVKRNALGQFHSDDGPTARWRDGFSIYCLNNVMVPGNIVMTPHHKLDPKMILKERNAEVRKEIVRKIGIERVMKSFNTRVLDKWEDYELLSLNLAEISTFGVYLKMVNPSTGTYHIERVCRPIYVHVKKPCHGASEA